MLLSHLILFTGWMLYGFVHSAFAAGRVKKIIQRHTGMGVHTYRVLYNLKALLGLAAILWYQVTISSFPVFTPVLFTRAAGLTLAASGLVLMLICIRHYFSSLSGLRAFIRDVPAPGLITSGIHGVVRHPLYLGTFAFTWGLFLWMPLADILITASCITLYTLIGMHYEERKLVKEYGQAYTCYQARVPMIIPRLGKGDKSAI